MVYLNVNKDDWNNLESMINKKDLYLGKDGDRGYGFETEPHVTWLYGLHEDVKDEDVKSKIDNVTTVNFKLDKISSFNNENFDVIKFDVTSDDFTRYNKDLSELPHTNSFKNYHPHCTVAYVKPGKSEIYIKKLNDFIKDNPLEFKVDKIVYSKVDGSKINYYFD
jgi:2'-5' RNA ligase